MTIRLLYLNGLAILMIPLHHATAYALQAMFLWTDRYLPVEVPNYDLIGTIPYHIIVIIRQFSTFSVPAFLFISGFFIAFLAKGINANLNWKFVLPRIKVLLFPFVIWTVLRFILLRKIPTSVNDLLDPYPFLPLLIQFYLLAPLLVWMAKRNWRLLLIVIAIFHLGLQIVKYMNALGIFHQQVQFVLRLTPDWFVLGQLPLWFPLGIVFGLHAKEFGKYLYPHRWKLLSASLVFLLLAIGEYYIADVLNGQAWIGATNPSLARSFYNLFFIFFILALGEKEIGLSKQFSDLGTKSLGIYMANIPAIYVVAVLMYRFIPDLLGLQLIYTSILFLVGLFGPLMLMRFVRNSRLKPGYRYLFG